jgi:hypothetical protein
MNGSFFYLFFSSMVMGIMVSLLLQLLWSAYIIKTLYFGQWACVVDFLPMTCGTCLMWLSSLYFEMVDLLLLLPDQMFGSSWWKGVFWLYNVGTLRSWNCNNDFNAFHIYWQRYILLGLALGHLVWVNASWTYILM